MEKVVIIGSGCAGWTAALYTARANLSPLVLTGKQPGGLLTTTSIVENFPGFPEGVDGYELMTRMQKQAERFGARASFGLVESIDFSKRPFTLTADGEKIMAETVIIATGASHKHLGVPGEDLLETKGVTYCATCDGALPAFRNQPLVVVGGGDSACDSVVTEVLDVKQDKVTAVKLKNLKTGAESVLNCAGVFVAIGHGPNTDIFKGQIELGEHGYIVPKKGTMTNVPGVFVAGDCADSVYRQAITAAGAGCAAAIDAERFLAAENQ
jgi:thioredoxin reductase (NADPH)